MGYETMYSEDSIILYRIGVLLESFTKHDADITCMVVNETKTKMLTGGIDGQVLIAKRSMTA